MTGESKHEKKAVEIFLSVRDILKKSGNAWAYNMCYHTPWKFYGTHSVDECVEILLDKYTVTDPNCGAKNERKVKQMTAEQKKHLEKINKTVIYKNGDAFAFGYSAMYSGALDCLIPIDKNMFIWNIDENASKFMGETIFFLTLGEIAEQLAELKYKGLVTVFVNRPMNGEIYQLGNYEAYEWSVLGKLSGFC